VKQFNEKNGTLYRVDVEAVTRDRLQFKESCKPVTITPLLEDILVEIKPTRRSRLDTVRYWWKGMKTEIEEYIQNCDKCFEHKPKLLIDRPDLHPIPVSSKAWSLVGIARLYHIPP